ncbi:Protein SPIRAL1-like 2 [Vitis vinifera]|uniref:Protein SPIRAL1-like 2 n=1 Tax=Vitis vinifera TaxID=29760 RepID=A0A438HE58_VITVI|nr:Protein SPIRAL1-like 2 [Vitis vinifera]
MGRGVSSGGGQSSLGYLFGSGETPSKAKVAQNQGPIANNEPPQRPPAPSQPVDNSKLIPAGINSNVSNNYFRADGQNCGNFITCFAVCTSNTAKVECRKLGQVSTVNQDDDHESCLLQLLGSFQPLLHHSLTQTGHPPRSMLLLVVDLPWTTSLAAVAAAVANNVFGSGDCLGCLLL